MTARRTCWRALVAQAGSMRAPSRARSECRPSLCTATQASCRPSALACRTWWRRRRAPRSRWWARTACPRSCGPVWTNWRQRHAPSSRRRGLRPARLARSVSSTCATTAPTWRSWWPPPRMETSSPPLMRSTSASLASCSRTAVFWPTTYESEPLAGRLCTPDQRRTLACQGRCLSPRWLCPCTLRSGGGSRRPCTGSARWPRATSSRGRRCSSMTSPLSSWSQLARRTSPHVETSASPSASLP
mmetsp:Transcript_40328/g.101456  ORF Transcript_40328/g.101456 Transcript_40328/m.101456 type:complete len:244 (+) Transcript_40328:668-1399(+)